MFRFAAVAIALTLQLACGGGADAERTPALAPVETPAPGGERAVGWRNDLVGADGAHLDWIAYYPAATGEGALSAPAMPDTHVENLTRRFGADVARALAEGRGHGGENRAVSPGSWPVLVFAPGWRLSAYDYRALLEDLASRGFVVLAIETSPPTERPPYAETAAQIEAAIAAAQAMSARADSDFARGLDVSRIGVIGHSVGGAAAALAASETGAVRAVVNLDGDFAGASEMARPDQPMLYLTSVDPREPARTMERRARVWARVSRDSDAAEAVRLPVFRHFNFLDAALVQAAVPAADRTGRFGDIDATRGLELSGALSAAFFDEHLRGRLGAFDAALEATPEGVRG
jgi:dienelactone hydrolase